MNWFRSILALFLFQGLILADQIVIPNAYNVLKVNGEKAKSSFFSKVNRIELSPGPQVIELQYEVFYDVGFDDHEKVTSPVFELRFVHKSGDLETNYVRPENLASAQKFSLQPYFKLINSNSRDEVPAEFKLKEEDESGILSSLLPQSESNSSEESSPRKEGSAVVKSPVRESKSVDTKQTEVIPVTLSSESKEDSLEQLRFWWSKADLEERKAFMLEILK